MRQISIVMLLVLMTVGNVAVAEQSEQFGDYVVHYNALTTDQLTPEVARAYGIVRSGTRVLLNVSVLKSDGNGLPSAVKAEISAAAQNLNGQRRQLDLREIAEQEAVYYIAIINITDQETLAFSIDITPEGQTETFNLNFREQFFTP